MADQSEEGGYDGERTTPERRRQGVATSYGPLAKSAGDVEAAEAHRQHRVPRLNVPHLAREQRTVESGRALWSGKTGKAGWTCRAGRTLGPLWTGGSR